MDKSLHKTTQIEILRHLAKRGYSAFLLALYSDEKIKTDYSDLKIYSLPLRDRPIITNALFVLLLLFFLPFYILRLKPDLLPISKKPKIILDARTAHFIEKKSGRDFRDLFFENSFRVAKELFDGITTITPMMKEDFRTAFNLDPQSIGVWTSGVNAELFNLQNCEKEGKKLRNSLGLASKFIVLYHGAFGASHGTGARGLVEMTKSIALLKQQNTDIVLYLLGSGQASQLIEEIVREHNLQENVIIHNPVDYEKVPKFIAMCDVGILTLPDLPEWKSQCPLVLLEYLAMGKPVIATNLPSNSFVMGDCKCGIYVSSCNPAEIAEGILFAYNHRQELREWGMLGKAIIDERFSWDRVAAGFEDYLLRL
jgi:glycosyltransferase involved in cell wall biosynthesis